MFVYNNLIVGSSFVSIGFLMGSRNNIICEENEMLDPYFSFCLRSYKYYEYEPKTKLGSELLDCFNKFGIIKNSKINVGAIEGVLSSFCLKHSPEILLKTRVLEVSEIESGIKEITIMSNSGIGKIYAKNVIFADKLPIEYISSLTLVYTSENQVDNMLSDIFNGAKNEDGFYDGMKALHIPAILNDDIDDLSLLVYDKWKSNNINGKIVICAPKLSITAKNLENNEFPSDYYFDNPIEAFERGYLYNLAKGGERL